MNILRKLDFRIEKKITTPALKMFLMIRFIIHLNESDYKNSIS